MGENSNGENPESQGSYTITHGDLIEILASDAKVKLLNSSGVELDLAEFSDTYLAPGSQETPKQFRALADDSGILIVRPEFDVERVITDVQTNFTKVIRTAHNTAQTRNTIKSSTVNPE